MYGGALLIVALSQILSACRMPLPPITQAQLHRYKAGILMRISGGGGAICEPQDQEYLPTGNSTIQKPEIPTVSRANVIES